MRYIDAECGLAEVYLKVKKALRPEITFIIGQPASGKTTLANFLVKCSNAQLVDAGKIHGKDDEQRVKELTRVLDRVRVGQKVVVEDFPANENQA